MSKNMDRMESFAAMALQGMLAAGEEGTDEDLVGIAWSLASLMETRAIQRQEKIKAPRPPLQVDRRQDEKKECLRQVLLDYGAKPSQESRVEFREISTLMQVHMRLSRKKGHTGINHKKIPEYLDLIGVEYDARGAKLLITNPPGAKHD